MQNDNAVARDTRINDKIKCRAVAEGIFPSEAAITHVAGADMARRAADCRGLSWPLAFFMFEAA